MALGTKRRAKIELEAETKAFERSIDRAQRRLREFGTETAGSKALGTIALGMPGRAKGKARGGGGGRGGFALGGAVAGVTSAVTTGVLGFLGNTAEDLLAFEKNLTRFQIASGKSLLEMDRMRQSILDISKATAVSSAEILAGAQTYVDLTGDVAGATQAMNTFARIAQASGATVSDVAQATAALQQSMGLKPEDIEAVFSGLIVQGKQGAVSLRDFAGELASLAPQFAKFKGGSGVAAIRDMGAAFQVARQGFGSASEAATGLESLMGAIVQNAKKFEKAGVKVFAKNPKTGRKELLGFHEIVKRIGESKLMKDPTALADAFGRKEAMQTFNMLQRNLALYDQLAEAGKDAGAVQRDLATFMASPAGRIEQAMAKLKAAVAEAFSPENVEAFANALVRVADLLASIIRGVESLFDEALYAEYIRSGGKKGAAELLATRHVRDASRMTNAEKIARAERLVSEAANEPDADVRKAKRIAADELRDQANPFGKTHGGARSVVDYDKLASTLANALKHLKVDADGNTIGTVTDNATRNRQPSRGR